MQVKTSNVEINIDESILDNLQKTLEDKSYVKIGVLGNGGHEGGMAYIASVHEFGASPKVTDKMRGWFLHNMGVWISKTTSFIKIPERSFLRLTSHVKQQAFQEFVAASRDGIFKNVAAGKWRSVLAQFGIKWEEYVHQAFSSRGWGQWPALSALTIQRKGSNRPLRDTGALEGSITSEVIDA